ncbi:hypothetical protein P7L53_11865 [Thermoleptolyngbya sichuanensis XZ-Cy5]|nr:hypothetical protein [Thermoleptolyngbya sichuanensis]MDG2616935.1 hypothetical protein [Thermoleptolyngbya sichuanensis XZ-Cy5]
MFSRNAFTDIKKPPLQCEGAADWRAIAQMGQLPEGAIALKFKLKFKQN